MRRKKIAVLMASIDREYQQDFASGLSSAGSKLGIDICIRTGFRRRETWHGCLYIQQPGTYERCDFHQRGRREYDIRSSGSE